MLCYSKELVYRLVLNIFPLAFPSCVRYLFIINFVNALDVVIHIQFITTSKLKHAQSLIYLHREKADLYYIDTRYTENEEVSAFFV